MVAPRKYPEELRERSIRMTSDARQDPASRPSACRRIGEQLGINPETLSRLGDPGRDRRRRPARHDDGGGRPARRDSPTETASACAGTCMQCCRPPVV